MPQFILVDHSLTDIGGHHYQYAAQILNAAKSFGFETHLACGKAATDTPVPPACDHRHTLFPHPSYGKWSRLYDGRKQLKQLDESSWAKALNPLTAARQWKLNVRRRIRKQQFAGACKTLFDRLSLSEDDHVFLPTMSEFDLGAFAEFLDAATDDLRRAVWHMQFHVSFWDGRVCDAQSQRGRLTYIRNCLQTAQNKLSGFDVRFYTTTDQLAKHYNELGVFHFAPLPYPANSSSQPPQYFRNHPKARPLKKSQPLRVLAAGKPRDEKGSHHLPAIAESVWPDLLAAGKLQLIVQTPQALDWAKTLAKTSGPNSDSAIVASPFPLGGDEYDRLLQEADIGLFLYDSDEYFARASGVMAELLAQGKPVITPAGCWLSEQGSYAEEEYLNQWRREHGLLAPNAVHTLESADGEIAAFAEFKWDGKSTGVLWQCELTAAAEAPTRIEIQQQNNEGKWSDAVAFITRLTTPTTTAFTPVAPSTEALRVRVYNAFGLQGPCGVALREYRIGDEFEHPRFGHHNLAAADWRGAARLLRDMVEHYDEYHASAIQFGEQWSVEHHPIRTLETLTGCKSITASRPARAA